MVLQHIGHSLELDTIPAVGQHLHSLFRGAVASGLCSLRAEPFLRVAMQPVQFLS